MSEITENMSFEEAMSRLDKITAELSRDGVELERAFALYEEAVRLSRICNAKLDDTQRKIMMLQSDANGEIIEKDFAVEATIN